VNASVIIPAYNVAPWIGETLESVLAQDLPSLEIIVVDDGSTDDTAGVVAKFGQYVRYVRQDNAGQGAARNRGIRLAQGDYIAFVDGDDVWLPNKLRLQWDALQSGFNWVYSDAEAFDDKTGQVMYAFSQLGRLYGGDVLEPLLLNNFIASPTPLVKRTVLEEVGCFNLRNRGEDFDLWLRIAARYPIALVNRPLARYRVRGSSDHHSGSPMEVHMSFQRVIELAVGREPQRLEPLRKRALANLHVRTGRVLAWNGDCTEARQMFARAIRLAPNMAESYVYWVGCLAGRRVLNSAMRFRRWLRSKRSLWKPNPVRLLLTAFFI
jgi:glycosyltransferase involved in cell wall biosynthesis